MPMIELTELRVHKGDAVICDVPSLTIDAGETIAIVGGNGSGKTTLLRVLAGIERDFRGRCRVAAEPREVVFVHQSPYLFRSTVLSNVTYGLRARGVSRFECRRRGLAWLARCGAAHLADKSASHLSGGERKRVAVARALAIDPKLILLDEPLEEVDAAGIDAICGVLAEIAARTTILVSSPVPPPAGLAARIVELAQPARLGART